HRAHPPVRRESRRRFSRPSGAPRALDAGLPPRHSLQDCQRRRTRGRCVMSELRAKLPELLPLMTRRAKALCRSEADAADLVQDTVERAMRFEHSYAEGSNLRAWILSIEMSLFVDRCRSCATTQGLGRPGSARSRPRIRGSL